MTQADAQLVTTTAAATPAAKNKFVELVDSGNMRTAQELRERVAAVQSQAFVLTPSVMAQFAPGYEGTPQVVVIDPSVDPESGRGADVYFQRSIHKSVKTDEGWKVLEVSLNKYGLLRVLAAVGVSVEDPRWIQDGEREPYLWMCEVSGNVLEFDGARRRLPPGVGSLDARDGSADIGEWTPEEWAKRVAVANEQKSREKDSSKHWKIKAEAINGWTAERVMQVRKYGRQLAQAKAVNQLARNLGVRQSYTVDELKKKPFIAVRVAFVPDMTNTRIAEMVTAHHLGALHTLYPQTAPAAALPAASTAAIGPVTHGYGEAGQTFDAEPESAERMQTAAPPDGVEEVVEQAAQEEPVQQQVEPTYLIIKVLRSGKAGTPDAKYFIETKEGVTLYTTDESLLPSLQAAAKDNTPRAISTERVMVQDKPYRQIVEITAVDGKKY